MRSPEGEARLAMRQRPRGRPLMHQSWGSMLFMHWPVPIEAVRRLVPPPLAIDTWEEHAWVALAPFTLWGLRPRGLPALPGISRFHEVNVRTYVHLDGVPGVWFFSLDASWMVGPPRGEAAPDSLEFFLIERYCLYAAHRGAIFRCRIHHRPWPLQQAALTRLQSGLLEAAGLPTPIGRPLLHAAGPVDVEVWPLERT